MELTVRKCQAFDSSDGTIRKTHVRASFQLIINEVAGQSDRLPPAGEYCRQSVGGRQSFR